jgi:hypothetical protein
VATWRNPLADTKPMTVGIFLLTALWAVFQWRDPTPPPVLDQILVGAFGIWFANEAIDKKNGKGKRSVKIGKDGSISMSGDDSDDEDEPAEDDDDAEDKTG